MELQHNMNIAVAMSGGVDSTAVMLRLLEENHNVIGLTMKLIQTQNDNAEKNIEDARKICEKFNVKHYVIDLIDVFNEKIVKYFIDEYLDGRTPNPCLFCNPLIKFKLLGNYAESLGYEYLATGHYARIVNEQGQFKLKKARYIKKDQSYFISRLPYPKLKKVILPLGEYSSKEEVRDYLENKGVKLSVKKESQEICFIPDQDYRKFIKEHSKHNNNIKPGDILDIEGHKVGKHIGIPFYTIGQRRGVNVAMGKPVYVREINPHNNTIIIGERKESSIFIVNRLNWLRDYKNIVNDENLEVKIRYRGKPQKCRIEQINEDNIKVFLEKPLASITPGQGAVFYTGDTVALSSIIHKLDS